MDSLLTAAARALAAGDALTALKHVALRDDPPALALRGIAMAQLGEYPRSRDLLRRAARGFGAREALARARCVVAEAEVALAMRELGASPRALNALEQAAATLAARGDEPNAWQARLVAVRGCLLMGQLDEAAAQLARVDVPRLPPLLAAVAGLAAAELALRSLRTGPAREALLRAQGSAQRAQVPALLAEVDEALAALERPAARRIGAQDEVLLTLPDVEALLASPTLVLDACRRGLSVDGRWLPLASRPVLFTLAQALAEAWPGDVGREALIERAFRTRRPDETHRARLRVEIGRLRALATGMAGIAATARGFQLQPAHGRPVVVMAPPIDGAQAALLALLADGAAWSTSALAVALGASQRTVQRALAELLAEGRVRCVGQGRARRWLAPPLAASGFTTILLLPAALPLH
jgi:tetratricopeptide (TPR) repeat protein